MQYNTSPRRGRYHSHRSQREIEFLFAIWRNFDKQLRLLVEFSRDWLLRQYGRPPAFFRRLCTGCFVIHCESRVDDGFDLNLVLADARAIQCVEVDRSSSTPLVGESAWNFADYMFPSGTCSGQVRWGFTYWSSPYPLATAFTTLGPFNPKSMQGDSMRLSNFRSEHIGVVNMQMCDGSARYINENIDHNLLNSLATRSGGEIIGEF